MLYLIDSANEEKIREVLEYYPVEGVTTNPTIVSRENAPDYAGLMAGIRRAIGPERMLHAQTTGTTAREMVDDAIALNAYLGGDFYVKIPIGREGLKATMALRALGVKVTMTAVFTAQQAMMAARAGAAFVAPYVNKLDDYVADGVHVVAQIHREFERFGIPTKVLAASFRNVEQVNAVAQAGGDFITLPPAFFEKLIAHPLTDGALAGFSRDWQNVYGDKTPAALLAETE